MSTKRPSSPGPSDEASSSAPDTKRAKSAPQSLHAWLHPSEPAALISHSPALHESSSTFVAFSIAFEPSSTTHITSEATLTREAKRIVRELDVIKIVGPALLDSAEGAFQDGEGRVGAGNGKGKERAREPDHRMWAVRTLGLKEGRNGTKGEDDFQLLECFNDDGEKFGGERVMRVLRENNGVDVLTVCCRWYGGDMIGPIRFQHIGVTTLTSLRALLKLVSLRDLRTTLEGLDEEITSLRAALTDLPSVIQLATTASDANDNAPSPPSSTPTQKSNSVSTKQPDKDKDQYRGKYDDIHDEARLGRLVNAKQKTRDSLQIKLGNAVS